MLSRSPLRGHGARKPLDARCTADSPINSRSRISQDISRNRLAKPNWHSACQPFGAGTANLGRRLRCQSVDLCLCQREGLGLRLLAQIEAFGAMRGGYTVQIPQCLRRSERCKSAVTRHATSAQVRLATCSVPKTIGKGRGTIRPHPTRVMSIDDY